MGRKVGFILIVTFVAVMFLSPAYAQEKQGEKKTDETKISGTIVQAEPDPLRKTRPSGHQDRQGAIPLGSECTGQQDG